MSSEQEIIAVLTKENELLKEKITNLEEQLYWMRKKVFGKMSEKHLPVDPSVPIQAHLV